MTIAYRAAEVADAPFVVSQWSRCFKSSRSAGVIADEDWPKIAHAQIQKLVSRPGVITLVAYENTAPTFLYGFISGEPGSSIPIVHFVCTKEAYRRAGYARGMFAAIGIEPSRPFVYTHWTPVVAKVRELIPLARHEPNYARIANYVPPETRSRSWKQQ